jgi:hypothetical protein
MHCVLPELTFLLLRVARLGATGNDEPGHSGILTSLEGAL